MKLSAIATDDFSGGGADKQFVGVKGGANDKLYSVNDLAAYLESRGVLHLVGRGGTPAISAGTGAGTSPTIAINGDDLGGVITITTGTTAAVTSLLLRVTFSTVYASIPRAVILTPASLVTNSLGAVKQVYVDSAAITTARFDILTGSTALTDSTAYKWFYFVKQ